MSEDADEKAWLAIAAYQIHERDKCVHFERPRLIDKIRRRVSCRTCDAELDAFDCLWEIAIEHERSREHMERLRTEAKKARERLDNLLREEANARARLARLKAKGTS